ncbi:MAG: hypothetical protein LBP75_02840 [Planctomycetota bacterium]|jgi:hypothetical protein|nr:hypothetical protein [Planctomycetota bacterium]
MLTMPLSFDALDWLARFKAAGFSEQQAKVQIEVIEKTVEIAVETAEKKIADHNLLDEKTRQELSTKGDIHDLDLKIMQLRADVDVKLAQIEAKVERVKADLTKTMVTVVLGAAIATMVGTSAIVLSFLTFLPK